MPGLSSWAGRGPESAGVLSCSLCPFSPDRTPRHQGRIAFSGCRTAWWARRWLRVFPCRSAVVAVLDSPNERLIMKYSTVVGSLVAASTLVGCGLSTPPTVGSLSSSVSTVPSSTSGAPVRAPVPPASPRAGPVFSGATMLGQRSIDSNSEDDPAAYHYRLQYSLDQINTEAVVDPRDNQGLSVPTCRPLPPYLLPI